MFIQIEETPNPNTLKFLPGVQVMLNDQSASFRNLDECSNSGLAKQLIEIEGISSVFFGSDFISITKNSDEAWSNLKTIAVATMVDYIQAGFPIIEGVIQKQKNDPGSIEENEICRQIKEVIREKVEPAVAQDGGSIEFINYEDGVVYVKMHGACSGCPSASITLKDGIQNMLQYYVPEVIRVEQI